MTGPGIYPDMSFSEYERDPCERPSLNSSVGKILLEKPPLYAWLAHPKLNPKWQPNSDSDSEKRIGSAVHKMLLGKGAAVVVNDNASDYRTLSARAWRDTILSAGDIPLLQKEFDKASEAVASILSNKGPLFDPSKMKPEQVYVWAYNNVLCRAMMDLSSDNEIIDVKTVESLSDGFLVNQIESFKYAFQACFYLSAFANPCTFRWIFIERNPPYEYRVIELDRPRKDIGMRQVNFVTNRWLQCLSYNIWPGYARDPSFLSYPQWAEAKWLEKEIEEENG